MRHRHLQGEWDAVGVEVNCEGRAQELERAQIDHGPWQPGALNGQSWWSWRAARKAYKKSLTSAS